MCVAVPMKVEELRPGQRAVVSFNGVSREISLRLLPGCRKGDYILLHAGYAIEKLDPHAAEAGLRDFAAMRRELGLE